MKRVALLLLAACGGSSPPPSIDNTSADPAASCPELEMPPASEPLPPGNDCVRGDLSALIDASEGPPTCHRVVRTDVRSGIEQAVLPDLGLVEVTHGGCAHWWVEIRAAAPADTGLPSLLHAGAALLRALPSTDAAHLREVADALAAAAADPSFDREMVTIVDGYEHAGVVLGDDGRLVLTIDVAL